jgi:hypothetical protein
LLVRDNRGMFISSRPSAMMRLLFTASLLLFVVFVYAQVTTARGATPLPDQGATSISVTS